MPILSMAVNDIYWVLSEFVVRKSIRSIISLSLIVLGFLKDALSLAAFCLRLRAPFSASLISLYFIIYSSNKVFIILTILCVCLHRFAVPILLHFRGSAKPTQLLMP